MTALFIILGYLAVGGICVKLAMPLMWRKASHWSYDDMIRESVVAQMFWWLLLWPGMLIWTPLIALFKQTADNTDPERREKLVRHHEQELAERDRRIRELEDELEIGDYDHD